MDQFAKFPLYFAASVMQFTEHSTNATNLQSRSIT
jgi:hypothetical protein